MNESSFTPGMTPSRDIVEVRAPFATFRLKSTMLAAAAVLALSTSASASTVAITEFMIDPLGTDLHHEWIELFNYGPATVDLSGWTLKDNASAIFTIPANVSIPSGGYLIVAQNGAAFTDRWLGGVADSRVISTRTPALDDSSAYVNGVFQLNNSSPGDGIYLRNAESTLIWSVGFVVDGSNAISPYRATWLTLNDFTVTNYGEPPQSGTALINRNGLDGTGTLGYEDNNRTADPFARLSSALDNGNPVEWGSPLAGGYTPVPEPAALGLLMLGSLATLRRRRTR